MFNPKKTTGLASLFGVGGKSAPRRRPADSDSDFEDESSGDDLSSALTYKPVAAPRLKKPPDADARTESTRKVSPPTATPTPAPVAEQPKKANSLVWNCSLHAFKLNNGVYEALGG